MTPNSDSLKCLECRRYRDNECCDFRALDCLTSDNDVNFIPVETEESVA